MLAVALERISITRVPGIRVSVICSSSGPPRWEWAKRSKRSPPSSTTSASRGSSASTSRCTSVARTDAGKEVSPASAGAGTLPRHSSSPLDMASSGDAG